jgi:hypothetical protein
MTTPPRCERLRKFRANSKARGLRRDADIADREAAGFCCSGSYFAASVMQRRQWHVFEQRRAA